MSAHRLAEWLCQTGALRTDAVSVEALTPLQMDRMRALQCASTDAYLELVKANPEEQSRVIAACAPSETWQFRIHSSTLPAHDATHSRVERRERRTRGALEHRRDSCCGGSSC